MPLLFQQPAGVGVGHHAVAHQVELAALFGIHHRLAQLGAASQELGLFCLAGVGAAVERRGDDEAALELVGLQQ
ncbi:hypothetical protein D3C79_851070 [compost metagenome]